jgi:phosphoglycolate phosphatase-like HAD superfamily hydrolase
LARSIIFFDLDGTLADSMAHIESLVFTMAVNDLGIPEAVIRKKLPHLLSLPASEAMPQLAALAGKDVGVLDAIMRRPESAAQPLTLFPEVRDVLGRLKAAGYSLILTTNSPLAGLHTRLAAAGVLGCFSGVYGTDIAAGVTKGPVHVRLAAADLGVSLAALVDSALMVGDQAGDIRLAAEFGMPAVGRGGADRRETLLAAGAREVIADLTELEGAITRLDGE